MSRRFKGLIEAVINDPQRPWPAKTTITTARNDANCVLEALLAEYGPEAAAKALKKQGLNGQYLYIIEPLHAEAVSRRLQRG
jgi:hypothetical protein